MSKISVEVLMNFLNSRNLREKTMIILFGAIAILVLDYAILIQPVTGVFFHTLPELSAAKQQLQVLKDDKKNKDGIKKNWEKQKAILAEKEKMFIAPNEIPALLEDLSKLAQSSSVKIISLKPTNSPEGDSGSYQRIPIRINALAGTHELGRFLARLEGGTTFFRITDLKITANPLDIRRHSIDLALEAYRKGA